MVSRTGLARKQAESAKGARWCLGDAYEPLLRVQDVSSKGRKARLKYQGREVHLFSYLEVRAFRHFQWELGVFGIEEQFYLEIEDTKRIAEEAGVKHPLKRGTQDLFEMSSDLVVYFKAGRNERRLARQMKFTKDLELGRAKSDSERRTIENTLAKLEIERRYWDERNVDWAVLTELELSEERNNNIETMLKSELDASRPDGFWQMAADRISDALVAGKGSRIVDLQRELSSDGTLSEADFTRCLVHLCATRQLMFDMEQTFSVLRPVSDFEFAPAATGQAG